MKIFPLCSQVASPATGSAVPVPPGSTSEIVPWSFQVGLVGGGSATVDIEASNDNASWMTLATITLDATTTSDGFSSDVRYLWVRADVTAVATGKVDAVLVTA